MLRLLLPLVLALLGVGAGIGAGLTFAAKSPDPDVTETAAADAATAEDPADPEPASEEGAGDAAPGDDIENSNFVKLNNQFIIPVLTAGRVTSMVVMSLSLEVGAETTDEIYRVEPKLRDAFLRVLFDHANTGGFDGAFTESAALVPLRKALRETAQSTLGPVVQDVLILDIVRQDTQG